MPDYVVQPGDSWAKIAGGAYGDQRWMQALQAANQGDMVIQPGQVIYIPGFDTDKNKSPYVSNQFVEAANQAQQIVDQAAGRDTDPASQMAFYWGAGQGDPSLGMGDAYSYNRPPGLMRSLNQQGYTGYGGGGDQLGTGISKAEYESPYGFKEDKPTGALTPGPADLSKYNKLRGGAGAGAPTPVRAGDVAASARARISRRGPSASRGRGRADLSKYNLQRGGAGLGAGATVDPANPMAGLLGYDVKAASGYGDVEVDEVPPGLMKYFPHKLDEALLGTPREYLEANKEAASDEGGLGKYFPEGTAGGISELLFGGLGDVVGDIDIPGDLEIAAKKKARVKELHAGGMTKAKAWEQAEREFVKRADLSEYNELRGGLGGAGLSGVPSDTKGGLGDFFGQDFSEVSGRPPMPSDNPYIRANQMSLNYTASGDVSKQAADLRDFFGFGSDPSSTYQGTATYLEPDWTPEGIGAPQDATYQSIIAQGYDQIPADVTAQAGVPYEFMIEQGYTLQEADGERVWMLNEYGGPASGPVSQQTYMTDPGPYNFWQYLSGGGRKGRGQASSQPKGWEFGVMRWRF